MSSHNDSFVASGSSPTSKNGPDFRCENHGSLFLLYPITEPAHSWIDQHLPPDAPTFGKAVVVYHRHIWAILEGIQIDGLTVSRRQRFKNRFQNAFGKPC